MQRFNSLLDQPALTAIKAHNKETQFTQKVWAAIAPDNVCQFSHASCIKNQQLTIFADNNAVAAKIKFFIPSLLIKLEKQECEVTSICIKVQVKSTPQARSKTIKKLSPSAANSLQRLANQLSGTTLGDTLTKLAKKAE